MANRNAIARSAGLARTISTIAPMGGICLVKGVEGGDEVVLATKVAVAIGLDVDYLTTAENDVLLRHRSTYVGHLAQRRAPMLFVVTDAETDRYENLIEMLGAIRDGSDSAVPWAIAVITTRDQDETAVHLSRGLDIPFREIQQA